MTWLEEEDLDGSLFICGIEHPHLVNDGIQGAEQQEASSPDQVLSQCNHVTFLLILLPCLCSLGNRTA